MLTVQQQQAARSTAFNPVPMAMVATPMTYDQIVHLTQTIAQPVLFGGLLALPAPVYDQYTTERDIAARSLGYTRRIYVDGGGQDGEFLIQHGTDLDSKFKAWAVDWQEWTWVYGWNVMIEELGA